MKWKIQYFPEVEKDFLRLGGNERLMVRKAIEKVRLNPLPRSEGGYGTPLGHKGNTNLTGFLKIKLRQSGIRVVYRLVRTETKMLIVVVGARADEEVYETASGRKNKYEL